MINLLNTKLNEKKKAVNQIITYNLSRLSNRVYGYIQTNENGDAIQDENGNPKRYDESDLCKEVDSASEEELKKIVKDYIDRYTKRRNMLEEEINQLRNDYNHYPSLSIIEQKKEEIKGKKEDIKNIEIFLLNLKAVFPEENNGGRKKSSRKKRKRHKSKKISSKSKIKKGGDCVRSST